ncbi:hypothetical protein EBB07_28265 [Paenibacillaceae bacterium]|nr:hypothetical protein EBB07_28265 [Paenibacillaceae bacterium]
MIPENFNFFWSAHKNKMFNARIVDSNTLSVEWRDGITSHKTKYDLNSFIELLLKKQIVIIKGDDRVE